MRKKYDFYTNKIYYKYDEEIRDFLHYIERYKLIMHKTN
jgi:hypothetical protein